VTYPDSAVRYLDKIFMAPKKGNGFITILTTSNTAIAEVAKSMLEEASMKYAFETDGFESNSSSSNTTFKIQVGESDAVKGKMLLADLDEINFEG
jgi:hypothetical protein